MSAEASGAVLHIEVAHSPSPGVVERLACVLPAGSTVGDALRQAKLVTGGQGLGVWGKPCDAQRVLRDGDRVELYRPLQVDPMEARRERQRVQAKRQQGAKGRAKGASGSQR